ncbi:MAG: DNA phosphorothioation-associated protein 4 [Thermodesulfobacteriota bacterium]
MRGVRRSIKYETIVRSFCDNRDELSARSIFPTMREFMCFAAVLGFQYEKRVPFKPKEQTLEIDGRIFSGHPTTVDLFNLIALVEEKSIEILRDENENEVLIIFEEYANGGFEIIDSWLKRKPDDTIGYQALISALKEEGFLANAIDSEQVLSEVPF